MQMARVLPAWLLLLLLLAVSCVGCHSLWLSPLDHHHLSSDQPSCPASSSSFTKIPASAKPRQPAVFVPHGGGPMPILGDPSHDAMVKWLTHFQRDFVTSKPDAIVLVTAHWEEQVTTITSAAAPELFYDYYGFPDAAYEIKYPAPGHPALASKIRDMLAQHGIPSKLDAKRGNDHGVFIPLKLMFPKANVPVVQMSIMSSLNPDDHIKVGQALHELRKENVLLVGSGLSFHSFKYFFGNHDDGHRFSLRFHEYLTESLVGTSSADERRERLAKWRTAAPYAREVHPREEHLVPLFVIAGAGLEEPCEEIFADRVIGIHTAGYLFGERS